MSLDYVCGVLRCFGSWYNYFIIELSACNVICCMHFNVKYEYEFTYNEMLYKFNCFAFILVSFSFGLNLFTIIHYKLCCVYCVVWCGVVLCVPIKVMREEPVALLYEAVPVQQLLVRLVFVPRRRGSHVVTTSRPKLKA